MAAFVRRAAEQKTLFIMWSSRLCGVVLPDCRPDLESGGKMLRIMPGGSEGLLRWRCYDKALMP